jgi:hypothetical protein
MSVSGVRLRQHVLHRVVATFVVASSLGVATSARADQKGVQLLFTQQDAVQAFDLTSGQGFQIGTAIGLISGTSYVEFQFVPAGPPSGDVLPIAFHNKVTITDIDGDQIFFDNDGTGSFHLGIPGAPFKGSGGPLRGTYVVTGATGKYSNWKVGSQFGYKAIATNPPAPNGLGNVYVEVTFRGRDDVK